MSIDKNKASSLYQALKSNGITEDKIGREAEFITAMGDKQKARGIYQNIKNDPTLPKDFLSTGEDEFISRLYTPDSVEQVNHIMTAANPSSVTTKDVVQGLMPEVSYLAGRDPYKRQDNSILNAALKDEDGNTPVEKLALTDSFNQVDQRGAYTPIPKAPGQTEKEYQQVEEAAIKEVNRPRTIEEIDVQLSELKNENADFLREYESKVKDPKGEYERMQKFNPRGGTSIEMFTSKKKAAQEEEYVKQNKGRYDEIQSKIKALEVQKDLTHFTNQLEAYNPDDSAFKKVIDGAFKTGKMKDFATFGLTEIKRLVDINKIYSKAEKGGALSPEEKKVLILNENLRALQSLDRGAFDFGVGLQKTLGFMRDMFLAGGLTGGLRAGIGNVFKAGFSQAVRGFGKKLGALALYDAAVTPVMPAMYTEFMRRNNDQYVAVGDENSLTVHKNEVSLGERLYKSYANTFSERFTENLGTMFAMPGVLKAIDKTKLGRKFLGNSVEKLAKLKANLNYQKVSQVLAMGGINEVPMETFEEIINAPLQALLLWEKEPLQQLSDPRFYRDVALQSAIIGGAGSIVNYSAAGIGSQIEKRKADRNFIKTAETFLNYPLQDERLIEVRNRLSEVVNNKEFLDENGGVDGSGVSESIIELENLAQEVGDVSFMETAEKFISSAHHHFGLYTALEGIAAQELGDFVYNPDQSKIIIGKDIEDNSYYITNQTDDIVTATPFGGGVPVSIAKSKISNILELDKEQFISEWYVGRGETGLPEVAESEVPEESAVVPDLETGFVPGEKAMFDGTVVKIEDITEDGIAYVVNEEGGLHDIPVEDLKPYVEELVSPQENIPVPEVSSEGIVLEPAAGEQEQLQPVSEEPQVPIQKDGTPDFDAMLNTDVDMFAREWDKIEGEEGTFNYLNKYKENVQKKIDKKNTSLNNETSPNKILSLKKEIQILSEQRDRIQKVLSERYAYDRPSQQVENPETGLSPYQEKVNRFISSIRSHNSQTEGKRKRVNLADFNRKANEIGMTIQQDNSGNIRAFDSNNNEVNRLFARRQTKEEIQAHPALLDYSPEIQQAVNDVYATPEAIINSNEWTSGRDMFIQGLSDAINSVKSAAANKVLDVIDTAYKNGLTYGDGKLVQESYSTLSDAIRFNDSSIIEEVSDIKAIEEVETNEQAENDLPESISTVEVEDMPEWIFDGYETEVEWLQAKENELNLQNNNQEDVRETINITSEEGSESLPPHQSGGVQTEGVTGTQRGNEQRGIGEIYSPVAKEEQIEREPVDIFSAAEKISDYGEEILGARKNTLHELSKRLQNGTLENLISQPFSKVFKKPDFAKMAMDGSITQEDALLLEACSQVLLSTHKPRLTKYSSSKKAIKTWAEEAHKLITDMNEYLTAEPRERESIKARILMERGREEIDSYRRKLEQWNEGMKAGNLYTPNPVSVIQDVLNRLDFPTIAMAKSTLPIIQANRWGNSYTLSDANGKLLAGKNFDSKEKATDEIVKWAKILRGDVDVLYEKEDFRIKGQNPIMENTGRYSVAYLRKHTPEFKYFDKEQQANTFVEELKAKKIAYLLKPETKRVGYENSIILAIDPTTEKQYQVGGEFENQGSAQEYLESNMGELSDLANSEISKDHHPKEKNGDREIKFTVGYIRGGSYGIILPKSEAGSGKGVTIKSGFKSIRQAQEYLEEHRNEFVAAVNEVREKKINFTYFQPAKERQGKNYRDGKDITPEEIANTFGFRGIQFGNWANQNDRQAVLNETYDAFMDMANVLDISQKAVSLGGELGIAFGARGSGSANAHYELTNIVINLTKTRGAGSLAHEWWHALDNYFSRRRGASLGMLTENPGSNENVRSEVKAAYSALVKAVGESEYGKRSSARGKYWGSDIETTARLFSEWMVYELEKNGERNAFLSRGVEEESFDQWRRFNYFFYKALNENKENLMSYEDFAKTPEALDGMPYPTREETASLGRWLSDIFSIVQERVDPDTGNTLLFRSANGITAEEMNTQFNSELQQQISGTLPRGHIYKLGNPGNILLSTGIPDLSIELSASTLSVKVAKDYVNAHPFNLTEIMNLPDAIQSPIAVFDSKTQAGSKVILTELKSNDANFVVAMKINTFPRGYRSNIQINDIRSIYPKDNVRDIVNWINRGDLLKWADKNKILNWITQQQSNSAEVAIPNKDLIIAANLVQKFNNPTIREGEMISEIENISQTLNTPVEIIRDVEQMPASGDATLDQKKRGAKGYYDTATGKVMIILLNAESVEDVKRTMLHEIVAHHGLRELMGKDFDSFLDQVYGEVNSEIRSVIDNLMEKEGIDSREATEEYLAHLAEKGDYIKENRSLWDKIKEWFDKLLSKLGVNVELSDNDLRYFLRRSYDNLKGKGTIENKAKDVLLRKELGIGRIMFRNEDSILNGFVSNNMTLNWREQLMERVIDRMISVKNIQDVITKRGGKVGTHSNPYTTEFLATSRAKSEIDLFMREMYEPLMENVTKAEELFTKLGLSSKDKSYYDVCDYLYAKHAPERNRKICIDEIRSAAINGIPFSLLRTSSEDLQKLISQYCTMAYDRKFAGKSGALNPLEVSKLPDLEMKILSEVMRKANKEVENIAKSEYKNNRSGMSNDETAEIIEKFYNNGTAPVLTELSENVKKCTNFTLDTWKKYSLISPEEYKAYKNMYKYYIPLRNWEETEEIDYSTLPNKAFNRASEVVSLNKKAEGRYSKADDPLAYIASLAHTAAISGNKNLIRLNAFRMVVDNKEMIEDLATIEKSYFIEGPEGAIETFVRPAQELFDAGLVKTSFDKSYAWHKTYAQLTAHQMPVIINGQRHIVTFKGDIGVKAAAAINNMNKKDFNNLVGKIGKTTRWISSNLTAKNPDFMVTNFARDYMFGNMAYFIEGGNILKLNKNIKKAFKIIHDDFFDLNQESADAKIYAEFKANGGQTGYIHMKDIKQLKKDIDILRRASKGEKNFADHVFRNAPLAFGARTLEYLGLMSENAMRFAVYKTEREKGASAKEAAIKAKEITVNFNRMGTSTNSFSAFYAFFNPTVQGTYRLYNLAKKNPKRFFSTVGTVALMKFAAGLLSSLLAGDDDEGINEYDKLSDYVKFANIVILNPFSEKRNEFIAIPMAQGIRGLTNISDQIIEVVRGNKTLTESSGNLFANIISELSPVDVDAINLTGKTPVESMLLAFSPTTARPFIENIVNQNYLGAKIYKENFISTQEGITPEYKKVYKGTSKILVGTSRWLNNLAGGTDETSSAIQFNSETGEVSKSLTGYLADINPAKVEHVLEGFIGGRFRFFNDLYKTSYSLVTGDDVEINNLPVIHRLYKESYFRPGYKTYYELRDKVSDIEALLSGFKRMKDYQNWRKIYSANVRLVTLYDVYAKQIKQMNDLINELPAGNAREEIEKKRDERILQCSIKYNKLIKKNIYEAN